MESLEQVVGVLVAGYHTAHVPVQPFTVLFYDAVEYLLKFLHLFTGDGLLGGFRNVRGVQAVRGH